MDIVWSILKRRGCNRLEKACQRPFPQRRFALGRLDTVGNSVLQPIRYDDGKVFLALFAVRTAAKKVIE